MPEDRWERVFRELGIVHEKQDAFGGMVDSMRKSFEKYAQSNDDLIKTHHMALFGGLKQIGVLELVRNMRGKWAWMVSVSSGV